MNRHDERERERETKKERGINAVKRQIQTRTVYREQWKAGVKKEEEKKTKKEKRTREGEEKRPRPEYRKLCESVSEEGTTTASDSWRTVDRRPTDSVYRAEGTAIRALLHGLDRVDITLRKPLPTGFAVPRLVSVRRSSREFPIVCSVLFCIYGGG